MSKPLERLVAAQLVRYLEISSLLPPLQSEFRHRRCTETAAVLRVFSDVLVLLDLSAAFDKVDHNVLLRRLHKNIWYQWESTMMASIVS